MKRWMQVLVLGLFLSVCGTSYLFALEMQDMEGPGGGGQGGEEMMMGGGKGMPRHAMKGPMMGGRESLVATSDGGIVILAGPRLLKYDKDLNLVREVELKKGKGPARESMKQKRVELEEDVSEDAAPEEVLHEEEAHPGETIL